jgi:uncharacterized damage-inducible protein DinB
MSARCLRPLVFVAALVLALAPAAGAHDDVAAPAAAAASLRSDFHTMLTDAEKKLIELAEATPPGKFAWSPGKGVRSTSEVFMHVAAANHLIPTFVGQPATPGIDPMKLESDVKEKDAAVKMLRESFASAHAAIEKTTDLDAKVKMFGMDVTKRYALLLLVTHAHEHLGQAIAYARTNDVTPPWTARAEAAAAAKKAEADKK